MLQIAFLVPTGEVNEEGPIFEEKRYRQNFVSGMAFRKTVAMKKTLSDKEIPEEEKIDLLIDYVVELFNFQFTQEEYYNGIPVEEVITAATACLEAVVNRATKSIGAKPDPNEK